MLYDNKGELINYLFINLDNTDKTIAYNRIEEFEYFFTLVSRFAKVGYAKYDLLTCDGYAISQWYQNLGEKDGIPLPQIVGVYGAMHPDDRNIMLDFLKKLKGTGYQYTSGITCPYRGWLEMDTCKYHA